MKPSLLLFVFIFFFLNTKLHGQNPVSTFSWADRHGSLHLNYTTSPKNQRDEGPCSVFASVSQVESMYLLHFNLPGVNIDLSEALAYSDCALSGPSTSLTSTLEFIKTKGIIAEDIRIPYPIAIPHFSYNIPCTYANAELVKIPYYNVLTFSDKYDLRRKIIKYGPLYVFFQEVSDLHGGRAHAYLLIGWKDNTWELLDSWQNISVRHYFTSVDISTIKNNSNSKFAAFYVKPYISAGNTLTSTALTSIASYDRDQDGYYNWGIDSVKPGNCPSIFTEADGDDSNCLLGPMDKNGYCRPIPPLAEKLEISAVNNLSGFCPNKDYAISAYVCGALEYEVQVIGDATKFGSGYSGNFSIHTSGTFGRVEIRVRARNSNGWSAYKSRFYYRYSYCSSSVENTEATDSLKVISDEDNLIPELMVYPVPVNNIIFVYPGNYTPIIKILVTNELGVQVKVISNSKNQGPLEIDVSDLTSGYYYLQIWGNSKTTIKKIVVVRN